MKYAFLHRNFKRLSLEQRVIFVCHALTVAFCFFPWISIEPIYLEDAYWNSAFSGRGALIGFFIFMLSLSVMLYFLDLIFESKRIKIPFAADKFFLTVGIEQIIFLILAWSVLMPMSQDFEASEIRFGFFASFFAQIVGLVGSYLYSCGDKKRVVRDFFQPVEQETPASPVKKSKPKPEKKEVAPAPPKVDKPLGGLFAHDISSSDQEE